MSLASWIRERRKRSLLKHRDELDKVIRDLAWKSVWNDEEIAIYSLAADERNWIEARLARIERSEQT